VALVLAKPPAARDSQSDAVAENTRRLDPPHAGPAGLNTFELGNNRLAVSASRESDRSQILERLESLANFDLAEPFERIREAIQEANKTGQS
jgi:hypothetical protein